MEGEKPELERWARMTKPNPTDLLRSAREDVGSAWFALRRALVKFEDAGLTDAAADVESIVEALELFAGGLRARRSHERPD